MQQIEEQIKEICLVSDVVVANPKISPEDVIKKSVLKALGVTIINSSPVLMVGSFLWKQYKDHKKKQEEKERMLRQIIAKQQAVINKLNEELKKAKEGEARNQAEIKNLREMLSILEKSITQIEKS